MMNRRIEPPEQIRTLVARCRKGWSLPREFYVDDVVYEAEIEAIWRRGWLFVGHTCQIPEPGDYFAVEVDTDSLIIVRDDDGTVRGLHNVCRHRGSLLCTEATGRARRFVCPYHQWVYGRDGALLACRGMQEELDKSELGLVPAHVRVLEGLIYLSLADEPMAFDDAHRQMAPLLQPQGFERAKVAKIIDYEIHANWKLVWENNRECFHCNVNHPQYIKANFDHYNADDTTPRIREELEAAVARSEQQWAAAGLAVTHKEAGMTLFPDAERGVWYSANRTPLVDGYVSESMDGKQVAPLMGEYTSPDVGTLRLRSMPNFWNHSSCDHAVSTRLLPAGPRLTRARVLWLVDAGAVEGEEYELERLLPFWQLTSEQDWQICENQQRGVLSRAYRPGPYSTYKEYNVDRFVQWYLKQLLAPGS
jgi:Rieske 2Fe-2S family protein